MSIIASRLHEEPYLKKLTVEILRTDDAAQIEALAHELVARHFSVRHAKCFHFEISVGATFGFDLGSGLDSDLVSKPGSESDSNRVMLKVFEPDMAVMTAQAQTNFQRWLGQQGFPCPAVLTDVNAHHRMLYRFEDFVDEGRRANGRDASDRQIMAQLLVQQVELGEMYPHEHLLPSHILVPIPNSPWPKPHNVLFDFPATKSGAEWIDEVGLRYKSHLESLPRDTVGHMDWGAKHCRMKSGSVSVVYDWDSVCQASIAEVIGSAAANFMTSWYVEGANRPTLEELLAFLHDCAHAAKHTFSAPDLAAAVMYSAAYGARCEHAIRSETDQTENRDFLKMLLEVDLAELTRSAILEGT